MNFSAKSVTSTNANLTRKDLIYKQMASLLQFWTIPRDLELNVPVHVSPQYYQKWARSEKIKKPSVKLFHVSCSPYLENRKTYNREGTLIRKRRRSISVQTTTLYLNDEIDKLFEEQNIFYKDAVTTGERKNILPPYRVESRTSSKSAFNSSSYKTDLTQVQVQDNPAAEVLNKINCVKRETPHAREKVKELKLPCRQQLTGFKILAGNIEPGSDVTNVFQDNRHHKLGSRQGSQCTEADMELNCGSKENADYCQVCGRDTINDKSVPIAQEHTDFAVSVTRSINGQSQDVSSSAHKYTDFSKKEKDESSKHCSKAFLKVPYIPRSQLQDVHLSTTLLSSKGLGKLDVSRPSSANHDFESQNAVFSEESTTSEMRDIRPINFYGYPARPIYNDLRKRKVSTKFRHSCPFKLHQKNILKETQGSKEIKETGCNDKTLIKLHEASFEVPDNLVVDFESLRISEHFKKLKRARKYVKSSFPYSQCQPFDLTNKFNKTYFRTVVKETSKFKPIIIEFKTRL